MLETVATIGDGTSTLMCVSFDFVFWKSSAGTVEIFDGAKITTKEIAPATFAPHPEGGIVVLLDGSLWWLWPGASWPTRSGGI